MANNLKCESKAGTVGAEEIQCWEANAGDKLKIMTFKDVKALKAPGSRRRMLDSSEPASSRMLSSTPPYEFICIQSDIDVRSLLVTIFNQDTVTHDAVLLQYRWDLPTILWPTMRYATMRLESLLLKRQH
jgi:hypothetical protein